MKSATLSPRRRRLRRTWLMLSLAATLGILAGLVRYFHNHPSPYRPGENDPDITSHLARSLPPDAPTPRLTDVTRAAGLGSFRTFSGDRSSQLPEDMGSGAAWGDFDNDGDDDLFLVSAGGNLNLPTEQLAPCELYENLGNGTFHKVEGFPETRIHGMAAAWGDYDGDGYLDLIVTGYDALRLFHNEHGTGKFTRDTRFAERTGFWAGAAWGDFDNDRRIDLYVCGYVRYVANEADRERGSQQLGTFVPYTLNPVSYQPATNLLFHNNGDGGFTEMAGTLGVANPEGRSLGALWHDFDDDGWLDLYVANDVSDNAFYRNKGGTFEDASHSAWVADYRSAMGLAAGDYNRDGDDDLFITHWVAQENALYDNQFADFNASPLAASNPPTATPATVPSRGKNYGLRFTDVNEFKGLGQIALPMVGWGTEFADFDGDGWLDLIVANGNTLEFDGPFPKKLKPQEAFLFWNRRGEYFYNLAPLSPPLSERHDSRGLALADYDNDGDIDVLLVQLDGGVQLLRNDMQRGHWFKVRLHSKLAHGAPLGFGDGAKVIAHVSGVALRRTISSASYLSQSSRVLHFGLGSATAVERLEVRWLGGQTRCYDGLAADAFYEITEDDPTPKRVAPPSPSARPHSLKGSEQSRPTAALKIGGRDERERLVEFWNVQRAAMNAMKLENNPVKAADLFRRALAINPDHEDSLYYLALCLAAQNDWDGALAQLAELIRVNPQSHRGHQQWGIVRALAADTDAHLAAAEKSLETAHALNPEETGALLALGEIALLRGDASKAERLLASACRTNPRAVGGFFLQGYLAWKNGDSDAAGGWLKKTRDALGPSWQPKGSSSEGDVARKQHVETTPLSRFWNHWDGAENPDAAFAGLDRFLKSRNR